MNTITENQAAFIRSLANRILSVNIERLPTSARMNQYSRMTYNPQVNARDAQKIAAEKLAQLDAGELTKIGASNAIDSLKVQARRAWA